MPHNLQTSRRKAKVELLDRPWLNVFQLDVGHHRFLHDLISFVCRKIITEGKLDVNTVHAQKEEEERKKRLAERAAVFNDTPNLKTLLTSESISTSAVTHIGLFSLRAMWV